MINYGVQNKTKGDYMKVIKRVIGKIISISALLVLCLTFALGVAGCRSTNPQKLSYWYGNYQVRNNAYGVVVFVWKTR